MKIPEGFKVPKVAIFVSNTSYTNCSFQDFGTSDGLCCMWYKLTHSVCNISNFGSSMWHEDAHFVRYVSSVNDPT